MPGAVVVNVSWNKGMVHTFTVAHSGNAHYPAGGPPPPTYAEVMISGVPAYWQVSPAPVTGQAGSESLHALSLSAMKSGYVVSLDSTNLIQTQDEEVMASILSHL